MWLNNVLIVPLFSQCRMRITTQLRSGTVDKSKCPVFLQNASGNPSLTTTGDRDYYTYLKERIFVV